MKKLLCAFTAILALFSFFQLYVATIWGAGLSTDSITYIEGARNIVENRNMNTVGTHYPPLYFMIIAFTAFVTNGDVLYAARFLQFLIIGVNLLLVTLIAWYGTRKEVVPTISCVLLFTTSSTVLQVHSMAWSEGLFCAFFLAGFYFLLRFIDNDKEYFPFLIISSLSIALAFLTRYVGITLIGTSIICLLFYGGGNYEKRLKNIFYFSLVSSFPMIVWIVHNIFFKENATNRNFIYHPITKEKITTGADVLLKWLFIPHSLQNSLFILLIVLLSIVTIYIVSKDSENEKKSNKTFEVFSIFNAVYILFLFFSISFFDAHTPLDTRILFPVYISTIISLSILSRRVYFSKKTKKIGYILLSFLLLLSLFQFIVQSKYLKFANTNGIGFANKSWIRSDILQKVKKLPKNTIIYTNGPDAISIVTGRQSAMLPRLVSPIDRIKNKNIERDIDEMVYVLRANKGVIVYLNGITWRWYLPTMNQLEKNLSLKITYRSNSGTMAEITPSIPQKEIK